MDNYKEEVETLRATVVELNAIIIELRNEIQYLKQGKTSRNSSIPPSSDFFKGKVQNPNRVKTGKKPGGQKGHEGKFLKFQSIVDTIVQHRQDVCDQCGYGLASSEAKQSIRGQIIDIPLVKHTVTEHISMEIICPCCSKKNKSKLPGTLDYCNVQYGNRLKDLIVYLSVRNYMPVKRISEYIRIAYGLSLSDGFIIDCLTKKAESVQEVYKEILIQIKQSEVVGSDETGFKIGDKKGWMWMWRTQDYVYFHPSLKRDYQTIEQVMGTERPQDFILISDRYAAQLKTECKSHQICLAHLLRDCINVYERYKSKWALKLKSIFKEIIELGKKNTICLKQRDEIVKRLDEVLHQALTTSHSSVKKLQKQLLKVKDYITTCLYNPNVPAENNYSERAIRNVKIKQKISTNLRSMKGAESYAIIRSIIDSAILQGKNIWEILINPKLIIHN